MPVFDDVSVFGAVELGDGALGVLHPQVGVGRVDEDREGVGSQVHRVQDHVRNQLQGTKHDNTMAQQDMTQETCSSKL